MNFRGFLREESEPYTETVYLVTAIGTEMKIFDDENTEIFDYELDTECSITQKPDHDEIQLVFQEFMEIDDDDFDMVFLGYDTEFEYYQYEFYIHEE